MKKFCVVPRHEAGHLYRVDFNLSCGYVIINPSGCESVLGYADRDDAEIEAGLLNAAYVRSLVAIADAADDLIAGNACPTWADAEWSRLRDAIAKVSRTSSKP